MTAIVQRDRWIPGIIIGFFIALVVLEAGFITLAVKSDTGLVTDNAYAGSRPVRSIAAAEAAAAALGWQVTPSVTPAGSLAVRVDLAVSDRDGKPLDGAAITASAERTTKIAQLADFEFPPVANGTTSRVLTLPQGGRWSLRLVIRRGDDEIRQILPLTVAP